MGTCTNRCWTQASGSHSLTLPVGSQPSLTSLMPNLSSDHSLSALRWPSLIPRSLLNFQEREPVTKLRHQRLRLRRKRSQKRRKKRKKKDPLDALPKGTFDLEEWKRFYSNNDEEPSIAWFWEHFDHENYSIWQGDYKYKNELTMVFMSCNLIGGMFQRLEKLKKNAFASACLFGSDNDSSISGIWVFKGQELAFELSEDWQIDYASYEWKKFDSKSEECKKKVAQYWKWEGEDATGRPFNQGKILK